MEIKYCEIQDAAIITNLQRLVNQIYKLLPSREEGGDWEKPLENIIEEFAGMNKLFFNQQAILFSLLCKLEGMKTLQGVENFALYRRTIFECLSLVNNLIEICKNQS